MADPLTPLQVTFLELEEADESAHMHIGAIMVFERPPSGLPPSRAELCRDLLARLHALPRYTQRLSDPHTGGLRWPEWLEDATFDIDLHIGRAALAAPGGRTELCEWASSFFSQRLDRRRPLWEMVIVEGLAQGRWALASKTHHCMVDGVGSVDVAHLLLDPALEGAAPGRSVRSAPSDAGAACAGARDLPQREQHGSRARAAVETIIANEPQGSARTSLNGPIGTRRRFEVVQVSLDTLREIRRALGGTIDDVVLCVAAGGMRELLLSRGEEPPQQGMRAMIPMNIRAAAEHVKLGNRLSSLSVELPVAEEDTARRYEETVARTSALKESGARAAGSSATIELSALAPAVVRSAIARALYAKRLFDITITNVPGPQATLYAFGSRLREIHPLVPLAASHALGVALVSYDGEVFFGIVADADSVPDLDVVLCGMEASLGELRGAARAREDRIGGVASGVSIAASGVAGWA